MALVFVPTEKEKAKIKWFIDNFGGEEDDPWLKDMVELAKKDGVHLVHKDKLIKGVEAQK